LVSCHVTTWRHNPEDRGFNRHYRENRRSRVFCYLFWNEVSTLVEEQRSHADENKASENCLKLVRKKWAGYLGYYMTKNMWHVQVT